MDAAGAAAAAIGRLATLDFKFLPSGEVSVGINVLRPVAAKDADASSSSSPSVGAATTPVPKLSIPERMALEDRSHAAILLQRVHRGKTCRLDVARRWQEATKPPTLSGPGASPPASSTSYEVALALDDRGELSLRILAHAS